MSELSTITKNSKFITMLTVGWISLISYLTVTKVAPQHLEADFLLNSIISIQRLTLYYWGQNRLLNVLPAATSFIKDPATNLYAILIITSFLFYLFLFIISRFIALACKPIDKRPLSLTIFVILSSIFVNICYPEAIYSIAICHYEYVIPAILLCIASYLLLTPHHAIRYWGMIVSIVLAIGINPSSTIPAFFIALTDSIYKRKLRLPSVIFTFTSIISYIIWKFISNQYGRFDYTKLSSTSITDAFTMIAVGLVQITNLYVFFLLLGFWIFGRILHLLMYKTQEHFYPFFTHIKLCITLFSICWFLLFANNAWVEMNQFHWRYFIYVIFGFMIIIAIETAILCNEIISKKTLSIVTLAFAILAIISTISTHTPLNNYKIFQQVNALSPAGSALYAGDYWVVWPSVLRDLMQGYQAYGLTYRAESNREAARKFTFEKIKENGYATVLCLNEKAENCIMQIQSVVGPIYHNETIFLKPSVSLIKVTSVSSPKSETVYK